MAHPTPLVSDMQEVHEQLGLIRRTINDVYKTNEAMTQNISSTLKRMANIIHFMVLRRPDSKDDKRRAAECKIVQGLKTLMER